MPLSTAPATRRFMVAPRPLCTVDRTNGSGRPLQRLVRRGWGALCATLQVADRALPAFVTREVEQALSCGNPAGGFAWLACPDGHHHRFVPFSCQTWAWSGCERRRGASGAPAGHRGTCCCGRSSTSTAWRARRAGGGWRCARWFGARPAGQRDGCSLSLKRDGGVLWTRRGVSLKTRPCVNRRFRSVCTGREGLSRGRCGCQAVAVGAALGWQLDFGGA
jgi:hypothetical protein